ncbi:MAG TPA: tetratricopeptide repeat protein [Xanthobacteraceae bacterium]|jgi:tetratricopeptide (TPR) repeat protein|nr:tetratricopeptide repeat protein [Xanthobacteraceae bacterium]
MRKTIHFAAAAALLLGVAQIPTFAPNSAYAVEGSSPAAPSSGQQGGGSSTKKPDKKKDKSSELKQFYDNWHTAYALVYDKEDYSGGIAVLESMGYDNNPDVATLIGYASRKLGRYDDAKLWYDRALAADPEHAQTWSYYGMWHAEQGNIIKAKEYLAKVESICGTKCHEYIALRDVIDGTATY